uniref:Uncharacterized protein n=1 Tax=Alexandrium monilatum TaxID=311494 RepID=A0A7S4RWF5_9DINO
MAEVRVADGVLAADCSGPEADKGHASEGELAERERELTREVPLLLDTMNRTSSEVNTLEQQVTQAQARYRKLLDQWSRLYEDVRAQHGSDMDRAKPFFEAEEVLEASRRRVHGAVREFSAASSQHTQSKRDLRELEERLAYGAHKVKLDGDQQDGLSRATVRVLRCQQERDRREQEHSRAVRELQEATEAAETWRTQIGDTTIKRALPHHRLLQKHQVTLAAEQTMINQLSERTRQAKAAYTHSMKELDRINVAVHDARKIHVKASRRPAQPDEPEAEAPPGEMHEGMPEQAAPEPLSALERAALDVLGDEEAECCAGAVTSLRSNGHSSFAQEPVGGPADDGPFS